MYSCNYLGSVNTLKVPASIVVILQLINILLIAFAVELVGYITLGWHTTTRV